MTAAHDRLRFELAVHRRAGLRRLMPRTSPAPAPAAGARPLFAPAPATAATAQERQAELDRVALEVASCTACKLCERRNRAVPGAAPDCPAAAHNAAARVGRTSAPAAVKASASASRRLIRSRIAAQISRKEFTIRFWFASPFDPATHVALTPGARF